MATTLVTAATTGQAWGQAWLVPTNPPLTVRELAARFTIVSGAPAPKLTSVPYPVLWVSGLFVAAAERAARHQLPVDPPVHLDSSYTEQTFGLAPTPIDKALASIRPAA